MSFFTLPLLATKKNQLLYGLAVGTYAVVVYGLAGELAVRANPATLPMTAVDEMFPLIPWTFWVYTSVYFIFLTSCAVQRDLGVYNRFLWGYVFAYSVSAVFFVLFPTTFPREAFPLPEASDSTTLAIFQYFRETMDHPTNCLPSMHVASAVMSTMPFYKRRPRVFAVFVVWALAIAFTTLTTKQHYAIDIITGGAFGLLCFLVSAKCFKYREPAPSSAPAAQTNA